MKNDSVITSLIFKKTLFNLLKNDEGMIVSIDNNMKPIYPGVDKVIVLKTNDEIHIIEYDGELENGEFIDIEFTED